MSWGRSRGPIRSLACCGCSRGEGNREGVLPEEAPTIADMRAVRGKRQLTMLRVLTLEELEAAERAGVGIVSVPPDLMLDPRFRDAAPGISSRCPATISMKSAAGRFCAPAFRLYKATADAVYCSAGFNTRGRADDAIPFGHVGLIPSRRHLDRRLSRRSKTAQERDGSVRGGEEVRKRQAPSGLKSRSSRWRWRGRSASGTSLFLISMGSGVRCGRSISLRRRRPWHKLWVMPRHSKVYRNFAAEYDRLQRERVAAFSEWPTSTARRFRRRNASSTWTPRNGGLPPTCRDPPLSV